MDDDNTLSRFDSANEAIFAMDLNGVITYCNKAAENLYEWTKEELIGRPFSLIFSENDNLQIKIILQEIKQNKREQIFENRRITKSSRAVKVSALFSPILDSLGNVVGISSIEKFTFTAVSLMVKNQELIEATPDAIVVANEQGEIVLVNSQVERLFGYKKEELLGQQIELLIPERFREIHKAHRKHFYQFPQERKMGEGRELLARRKDGSEFFVDVALNPLVIEGTTFVSAAIRDISDQLKTKKRFKDLLDLYIDAVVLIDNQGKIQEVNKQAEYLFGYSRNEMLSQHVKLLVPEQFPNDYLAHINDLFVNRQKRISGLDMTLHGKRKDGSQFPTEITLAPLDMEQETLVSAIVRDITSRKAFERQLRESEQLFRLLVDVAIDSILTVDDQGTILSYNNASETIFGYPQQYIIGKNIILLLDRVNSNELRSALQYPENPENQIFFEKYHKIICKRENGETFPAEVSIGRTVFEEKPIYIWILRDITERERLTKMKTEFVSTVSHELRTPLTSINGAIGLILMGKGGKLTPEMKNLVDIAHRNSERLVLLVNDILDVEKIEADKMTFNTETVDLVDLIPAILESDRVYADKFHVNLTSDIPFQTLKIKTDRQRLTQVITNLLSNAVKFSPPQETVKVKVERRQEKVRISVIDRGPGIPHNFQAKLFQKFVQVDSSDNRQRGGTGLGLVIAKAIIQKLGGTIGFKSETGKGSTFYIELDMEPGH